MMGDARSVDVVYVAASEHDAPFTRSCVASIRRLYPDVPIKLLAGGPLQRGLVSAMRSYWNTSVADLPAGDYGWGLVKLEPLFGPPGERFLVLDSDTVMAGPVLGLWSADDPPFLVDDEDQSAEETRVLYYDWERLREIDPIAHPPAFVFNSGQWFGTAGILTRQDFDPWVEWTFPRRLRHPECFMPGDQGVLNYVLNRKVAQGKVRVKRDKIMRWAGHGVHDLGLEAVAARRSPSLVVHWAGVKKGSFRRMAGGELLEHFDREFYRPQALGALRHSLASLRYRAGFRRRQTVGWLRLALRAIRHRTEALRRARS